MAATVTKITCKFIGDFKVGDNLILNADALCKLSNGNEKGVFNKLMVIQAGSIVEAALNEIVYRATTFTKEGVPNISKEDRNEIATKTVEKFNVIIDVMKKYKILDGLGAATIYDELHKLRKYRNKVHIQTDVEFKACHAMSPLHSPRALLTGLSNLPCACSITSMRHTRAQKSWNNTLTSCRYRLANRLYQRPRLDGSPYRR